MGIRLNTVVNSMGPGKMICSSPSDLNSNRERSGSVVECLTRDRGAAGSSLTRVTALCP